MAKKTHRILVAFRCSECGKQNYISTINKLNNPDYKQFTLKKYCNQCKKHTVHKIKEKLK